MSSIPLVDVWSNPPRSLKVTVHKLFLPDCVDSDALAGDYIVELWSIGHERIDWRVNYAEVCGFDTLRVRMMKEFEGTVSHRVQFSGAVKRESLELADVKELISGEAINLSRASTGKQNDKPSRVTVVPRFHRERIHLLQPIWLSTTSRATQLATEAIPLREPTRTTGQSIKWDDATDWTFVTT